MSENAIFVIEKNQMNTLDKSLIQPSIAVLHLVAPLKQLFRGKNSICVHMWDNLANILQNLAAKSWSKTGCYVLLGRT